MTTAVDPRRAATARYLITQTMTQARAEATEATGKECVVTHLYIDNRTHLRLIGEIGAGRFLQADMRMLEHGEWYGAEVFVVHAASGGPTGTHVRAIAVPLTGTMRLAGHDHADQ